MSTSAKVSVVSNLVALAALALAWTGAPIGLLVGYEWHKLLHLTGVILFFGNMIVGPLWLVFAWSDTDRQHFGFAVRTLVAADIWLTMPGVQLTVWNGVALATAFGGARTQPWLVEALALVVLTSLLAILVVLPAQESLARACGAGDERAVRRALIRWSIWGVVVSVPPTIVVVLMVTKRALLLGS
ncbi:MAG: DUF2269 family protein [Deltaproteobacteria bacterium]|nr:DUF2269 family protein [Deltaproteobacteria bacterium]